MAIILMDTSIFVALLNVPNMNELHQEVSAKVREHVAEGNTLLLPLTTILETGNHISQQGDGNQRRQIAQKFCEAVKASIEERAPWRPLNLPDIDVIKGLLQDFPDKVLLGKTAKKSEGTSFGDLLIMHDLKRMKQKYQGQDVKVWTLDKQLESYCTGI